jgi:hypothetical protein
MSIHGPLSDHLKKYWAIKRKGSNNWRKKKFPQIELNFGGYDGIGRHARFRFW